jgi:serine phosphatase RsbU (regulator of sigma subunit)
MTHHRKPRLRVHKECQSDHAATQIVPQRDEVLDCLSKFAQATGWGVSSTLQKQKTILSDGIDVVRSAPPHFTKSNAKESKPRWQLVPNTVMDGILDQDFREGMSCVSEKDATALLNSIELLVARLERAENAVRQQQAQLATEVSITRSQDDDLEMADRFESILESSCRSIQATAAAIYLLDDATSELKMRACWNLPIDSLMAPARTLRGSLADLEALLGNAVLIEDTACSPNWPSPEDFASAIVVPIGSVSMPHGTIWFWSDRRRNYHVTEVEVANMASGRVMGELEQAVLGVEVRNSRTLSSQMDEASIAQAARWPKAMRMHDDFDVGGWSIREGDLGGSFHDWDVTPSENLVCLFGDTPKSGPQGAIVATSINAITRSAWNGGRKPSEIMQSIGDYLFAGGEEDWLAHASLLQMDLKSGRGCLASAGSNQLFIVSDNGFRPIGGLSKPLAATPMSQGQCAKFVLQPGEVLIGMSSNLVNQLNLPAGIKIDKRPSKFTSDMYNRLRRERRALSKTLDQHELLREVREMLDEDASEIARHICTRLPTLINRDGDGADRSLLVVRNATKACRVR